jgi:hypothetical protein
LARNCFSVDWDFSGPAVNVRHSGLVAETGQNRAREMAQPKIFDKDPKLVSHPEAIGMFFVRRKREISYPFSNYIMQACTFRRLREGRKV